MQVVHYIMSTHFGAAAEGSSSLFPLLLGLLSCLAGDELAEDVDDSGDVTVRRGLLASTVPCLRAGVLLSLR